MLKTEYFPSSRPEMLEFVLNKPQTSLEIGCRQGLFSRALKEKRQVQETWGVEPDEEVRNDALCNLDHFIGDFFDKNTKLPTNYFDLIVFNDVLKHMYNPWEALKKTRDLLKDDGIVVISLPNIRHKSILIDLLFHDNFEYKSAGILDSTHIRFFTKRTMIKLFQDTGFEILKQSSLRKLKKKKWYYFLKKPHISIFNLLTFNHFESIFDEQYGFTLGKKL